MTITSYQHITIGGVLTGAAVSDNSVSMTVTGVLTNSAINWNL